MSDDIIPYIRKKAIKNFANPKTGWLSVNADFYPLTCRRKQTSRIHALSKPEFSAGSFPSFHDLYVRTQAAFRHIGKNSPVPYNSAEKLAFSCRWDDNNSAHLRMHGLMCRYGFRGTFYLNDLELIPPEGIAPEVFLGELLSGGCAAGAHGVRHASLAELTDSDEIFRELGVCRAMLEAACSAPVTAHAFAYGAYRRAGDPGAGRRIADCFTRCGFLHESYGNFPAPERGLRSSDFSGEHWILPGDCDTSFSLFRQRLEERLADSRALEINPNLTVGLHSRQNGDGWREMEQCYSAYAFRPDWWYCTAGDYGAYRYEYHHAEILLGARGNEPVTIKVEPQTKRGPEPPQRKGPKR